MAMKRYAGVGCVYMAPVNAAGVKTGGFRKVGDANPFTVQVETEKQEHKSRMCDTAGQVLAVKTEISSISGGLTLKEWNAANLAMALAGEAVELTGAGGAVVDEAVTALAADEYMELIHDDVSSVVVQDVTDTTTYVEGVDYTLNSKLGLVAITGGGGIAAGDVLHIDYDYGAESGYRVNVGTTAQIRVAIRANLRDEFDASREFTLEIDSAVLASDSAINFISESGSEGEDLSFTMSLETISGQTSPMRIDGMPM